MNEEVFEEVLKEAETLFKMFNTKIKGQQLSVSDDFNYWIACSAYRKGYNDGYEDCYQNGITILDAD